MASALSNLRNILLIPRPLCCPVKIIITASNNFRTRNKLVAPKLMDLQQRKQKLMRENKYFENKRSDFIEWNYEAERYAFCKRINEEINENLLIKAFDANEYDELFSMAGKKQVNEFCCKYLRLMWKALPEEGIQSACSFLMENKNVSTIARGIGMKDLVISNEFPVSDETYANSFYSLVNAITKTAGTARSEKFILDFVVTGLVGKDVWDFWNLEDPLSALKKILANSDRGSIDPRMLGMMGKGTLEAVARVGIYSDKQLLGEGCEDDTEKALKIAAYNSLSTMFGQSISKDPLIFDNVPTEISHFDRPNTEIANWALNS